MDGLHPFRNNSGDEQRRVKWENEEAKYCANQSRLFHQENCTDRCQTLRRNRYISKITRPHATGCLDKRSTLSRTFLRIEPDFRRKRARRAKGGLLPRRTIAAVPMRRQGVRLLGSYGALGGSGSARHNTRASTNGADGIRYEEGPASVACLFRGEKQAAVVRCNPFCSPVPPPRRSVHYSL